jgi:hypothetical protein
METASIVSPTVINASAIHFVKSATTWEQAGSIQNHAEIKRFAWMGPV